MKEKINFDKKKGILFDLDGTLFDTLKIWDDADKFFIRQYGKEPNEKAIKRDDFIGSHSKSGNAYLDWNQYLIDTYKIKGITSEEALKVRHDISGKLLSNLKYNMFADKFLLTLKSRGKDLFLVTSTNNSTLNIYKNENQNVKAAADMNFVFDNNFVTADMVENKKPAPDPYLLAIKRMGLEPEECLAFEDSLVGCKSAQDAGIDTCIVYEKHSDRDRAELLRRTPYHIDSFGEVLNDLNGQRLCRLIDALRSKKEEEQKLTR